MRFIGLAFIAMVLLFIVAIPVWIVVISALGVVAPWLLFGLLIWAVFSMSRGPRRQQRTRHSWQTQPWSGYRTPRPTQARAQPRPPPAPAQPAAQPRPELPIDVQVKVEQI